MIMHLNSVLNLEMLN